MKKRTKYTTRLRQFEEEKKLLERCNLDEKEYEKAVRDLCKKYRI